MRSAAAESLHRAYSEEQLELVRRGRELDEQKAAELEAGSRAAAVRRPEGAEAGLRRPRRPHDPISIFRRGDHPAFGAPTVSGGPDAVVEGGPRAGSADGPPAILTAPPSTVYDRPANY